MSTLHREIRGCKAQRAGHSGSMFKRCNTANGPSYEYGRMQPFGLKVIFAHFGGARRSHATLHHPNHSSRLELHKNGHQRGHE
jgi:hypothetical protein